MKKYLLSVLSILFLSLAHGQYNIIWRFGTSTSTGVASVSASPHTSASVLVRQQHLGPTDIFDNAITSSGYTDASGDFNIQMIAQQGGAIGAGNVTYVEFSITPDLGYALLVTAIKFGSWSDASGPVTYNIRSDVDNYAADIATGALANTAAWELKENTGLSISRSGAITIRIYGNDGTGTLPSTVANWRLDDISLMVVSSLLPIKFADVSAKPTLSGNNIQWSNLTESDMAYYSVEYADNGKDFSEIAKVNPSKNDNGTATYSYTHTNPETKNSFYRIKGVELSGTILYSNIVTTSSAENANRVQLYPNPAINGNTALKIASLPKGIYELGIVNLAGQTVYKQSISHGGGGIYIPVRLPYISGMYSLKLNGKNTQIIKTVIVDKR